MSTMFYTDEIRDVSDLDLPEDDTLVSEAEVAMANTLIDQMVGPFEPEEYRDEYHSALEQVIEVKLGTAEAVTVAPTPPKGKVVDLMEALKASIEATKREAKARPRPRAKAAAGSGG